MENKILEITKNNFTGPVDLVVVTLTVGGPTDRAQTPRNKAQRVCKKHGLTHAGTGLYAGYLTDAQNDGFIADLSQLVLDLTDPVTTIGCKVWFNGRLVYDYPGSVAIAA